MAYDVQTQESKVEFVDPREYVHAMEVARSVVRRAIILVQRYGQFRCNDLCDRGLKTEMRSSLKDIDEGVCLVIEFIPNRECVRDAVSNRQIKNLIRKAEKEYRRMERKGKLGS